ncbi:uncharacterized protein LOC142351024 [Convolutriloba macropyga]|uniref:uncharacterized protein LOC142351024 n=1 Tax=Convolutriloba macropyga TaxID=536237 RepID=UPI003F51B5C5
MYCSFTFALYNVSEVQMMENVNSTLRRLHTLTSKLKYTGEFDADRMRVGDSYCLLPICNFALLNYSPNLALEISNIGVELYGVSDAKFVEGFYRIMRDIFNYQPKVKQTQFLSSSGFAEKKISLVADIIHVILSKYPTKAKAKVVAASRVFPPNKSAPPNMGKVERTLPLMLSDPALIRNIHDEKILSSFPQPALRRGFAAPVLPSNIESQYPPSFAQHHIKVPEQSSETLAQGNQDLCRSDQLSSANISSTLPKSTLPDHGCQKCLDLEKQTENFTEVIDTLTNSFSNIALKLERLCSLMESSATRQMGLEKKVDQLLQSSSSKSGSTRTLDNLSARTSLLETKLQLLEESTTYNTDRITSKTADTSSFKHIHDTSLRAGVLTNSGLDTAVVNGRGDHSFSQLSDQGDQSTVLRSEVLRGSKENLELQNTSSSSQILNRNFEEIIPSSMEANGFEINGSGAHRETGGTHNLASCTQTSKALNGDLVTSPSNIDTQAIDQSARAAVDSSLLMMPSSLNEQKARIEALFMETSSALKVPLAAGVDKENLSRNSSFDRKTEAD